MEPSEQLSEIIAACKPYNKVFGHPELDKLTIRSEGERDLIITRCITALQAATGRQELQILDIGCANGYFSFRAKELGCRVTAIDTDENALKICKAVQDEQKIDIDFQKNSLTLEYVQNLKDKQYDVILLLNVIHYIACKNGFEYAKKIMDAFVKKCVVFITELALKQENSPLNKNSPEDYYQWVTGFNFIAPISFHYPQHFQRTAKNFQRPLMVCSHEYAWCEGFYRFDLMKKNSFDSLPAVESKCFFIGENIFIKHIFKKKIIKNYLNECKMSVEILKKYPEISFFPKLLAVVENQDIFTIATEIDRGDLLYDRLKAGKYCDKIKIITDVLENLIELETKKLYHNDIRAWNIVINKENTAYLIDIGAITGVNRDILFSFRSTYLTFLSLFYSFMTGALEKQSKSPSLLNQFNFYHVNLKTNFSMLEPKMQTFFRNIVKIKSGDLTFKKMKEQLLLATDGMSETSQPLVKNVRVAGPPEK